MIDAYGDLKFRAYPDSTEPGRLLYFGGLPDYDEMWFMRRYLRPGDSVIDGGRTPACTPLSRQARRQFRPGGCL